SVSTSDSESSNPPASLTYAATSSGVKRRSRLRSSTSSPRARSRASGKAGSDRVLIARCTCGGRGAGRNTMPAREPGPAAGGEVVVVEHDVELVGQGPELVEHRGQDSLDRWPGRLQQG